MLVMERRRGTFLSIASPLYPMKAVGMYRLFESPSPFKNIGEPISQAVYPRASKVERSPPLGKDEVSDSPLINSRSEEHTSELQSRQYLVCRLLLEKKKSYKLM